MYRIVKYGILVVAFSVLAGQAFAFEMSFNDFSAVSQLTLNGDAEVTTTGDGEVLRLTQAEVSQAGNAFSTEMFNATAFSSHFTFRISNSGSISSHEESFGADGIAFVVQSNGPDITANDGGGWMAYGGIQNSVAVEFDTFYNNLLGDLDSNHIGVLENGSVIHQPAGDRTVSVESKFDDASVWHAWIDYNGTHLEVRANQSGIRSEEALLSVEIDIPSVIGSETAHFGFTSATGFSFSDHDILSLSYIDSYDPITSTPEPSSVFMFGIGLAAALGWWRKNNKS